MRCVVADLEIFESVDRPSDVEVGVLREPGVGLHLAGENLAGDEVKRVHRWLTRQLA